MKKVISFSLWGGDPKFTRGALLNIPLARKYYSGWETWFYCGSDVPESTVSLLERAGGQVIRRVQSRGEWEGLFWRFEPIFDPTVAITISRDCDSRLNPREQAAIQEWLFSRRQFHCMRDHFEHNVPLLGGMIGFKHWKPMQVLLEKWPDMAAKGADQVFLHQKVWPIVRADVLAHDRYWNGLTMPSREGGGSYKYNPIESFGEHECRDFPAHDPLDIKAHGEHVGAIVNIDE
jgi:protein O-GlcNAc transferase